jgi:hypothetical protein
MVTPVRATPSQVVELEKPCQPENLGSYPDEITKEQFDWLHARAAERRRRWTEHAQSVALNQKA